MAGILLQWYLQITPGISWQLLFISFVIAFSFFLIPFFERYKRSMINGISITVMFIAMGSLLSWYKNIRHERHWFGHIYAPDFSLIVTLTEDPLEKTKSFKANASVDRLLKNDSSVMTKGKIILYFKKDSSVKDLAYGSQIMINKHLQEIKNSGNPGGFDYKQYSLFQGITHQVYLKENEFKVLPTVNKTLIRQFINSIRAEVLHILRTNIKGDKELGLAEALLIGYKNDLDKSLVQSYSNTGVVHVIAISGLHLGLIYWLLTCIFKPLQKKQIRWLRPVFILTGLWLFTLLAGAQPSVLRSAFMFSCIVIGDSFQRRSAIYNSLAFSAFLLLCLNPFWLWDVGFQLSYAAVLSIVIFMQPIYHWFFIKNKILDFIWKLNSVTIAAQILTFPVSVYHFHQFPVSFLLTNFVAVPLSSFILLSEILLCVISPIGSLAAFIGRSISRLIWLMNTYIEQIEKLPFSLWNGLQITIPQTILLTIVATGIGFWLLEKNKAGCKVAVLASLFFIVLRTNSFVRANEREQLIIYNVPQKQAIDLIEGRKVFFAGDKNLPANDLAGNFHIKPSRIMHRVEPTMDQFDQLQNGGIISYKGKTILTIKNTIDFLPIDQKIGVDLLIISGSPKLYFTNLVRTFLIKQVVFDAACPGWKINYWKKDCNSLGIPYHDVSENGAFVMNLN